MKEKSKPVRYGIMPLGLVYLGIYVIFGTALLSFFLLRQIMAFFRWLDGMF